MMIRETGHPSQNKISRKIPAISKTSLIFFLICGSYVIFWLWLYFKSVQFHLSTENRPSSVAIKSVLRPKRSANAPSLDLKVVVEENTTIKAGTFVIQVRGEMGNNLQKLAHGHGLKWYAEDEFGFSPQLLIRHLKKPKWKIARDDIYQCFPKLRSLDYESGLSLEFTSIQKRHPAWLGKQQAKLVEQLPHVKEETDKNITAGLRAMKNLIMVQSKPHLEYPIVVLGGPMRNAIIDKYYQRFRDELFVFDDSNSCCAEIPGPDEVVFHFRHFAKELSVEEQKSRGFEELDPQRVATQLMGHLKRKQKVAMTTRFDTEPIVEEYRSAMEEQGFQVRVVTNQTGVQDFCFLLRARQELLGVAKSTYARWAAYLGDAERVQLYALDNVGSKDFTEQTMRFPWTNPEFRRRIHFPVFASMDEHEIIL